MTIKHPFHIFFPIAALGLLLSGCGGGSGGGGGTTVVSGSVFAAPVSGASCEIQDSNGVSLVPGITTDANGNYSAAIPDSALSGDLMLLCSGGSYGDEAAGSTETAGEMAAYVAGGTLSAGSAIHVTPGSTIVQRLVKRHGKSLADAQSAFNSAFGYTPDTSLAPTNATAPASNASDDEKLGGLRAAAFSQLTSDLGLTAAQQFALLDALASDLSDGVLDGVDGSGAITIAGTVEMLPADIQSRFGTALLNFHGGSKDATALGNDKIGVLPFAKSAFTTSYRVEYLPGMMAAMQGQTMFRIRISDRSSGQAVSGQSVTLMAMMHMAGHSHATPQSGCSESSTAGTYDCTIYYLMASTMMDGSSMGYWDLQVMIGGMPGGMMGESVHFYPGVMMAMGDTVRATLKNSNDQISNTMMGTTEARSYYLFKSALTAAMGGTYTFKLFIAANESMMSYPAVTSSTTLSQGDLHELVISSMSVEVSTDGSTWTAATENGSGYWTITGLTGLTSGTQGSIYVRMSINGVQYSTNGDVASGSNGYATFSVTPAAMSM